MNLEAGGLISEKRNKRILSFLPPPRVIQLQHQQFSRNSLAHIRFHVLTDYRHWGKHRNLHTRLEHRAADLSLRNTLHLPLAQRT
jgi:hypothetical protein